MLTTDSIVIGKELEEVFSVAADIERQHEFIPGYKPSKIIETSDDGSVIVEREANIGGKDMKWKSRAVKEENRAIRFEQLEGRLKGMKIVWDFERVPGGTQVKIIHDFSLNIPIAGALLERYVAKPKIDHITRNVLLGLKNVMEGNK